VGGSWVEKGRWQVGTGREGGVGGATNWPGGVCSSASIDMETQTARCMLDVRCVL